MHIQANHTKDNVWLQRSAYIAAENEYREKLCKINGNYDTLSLAGEVAKARQQLKKGLENLDMIIDTKSSAIDTKLHNRLKNLEKVNGTLQKNIKSLEQRVQEMEQQIKSLTSLCGQLSMSSKEEKQSQKVDQKPKDDDDVDLFGSDSDSEDETAQKIREERLAAYNEKKSKKPTLVAKSNIIFDVKPWDDETDMVKLEAAVRSVTKEGLLWGAGKLVPLAYGIHKLQISCVIEDELVSVDWIQETIESGSSDFVQSVDIAAFNKI